MYFYLGSFRTIPASANGANLTPPAHMQIVSCASEVLLHSAFFYFVRFFKGGFISQGIINLVLPSKKCVKSPFLNFSFWIEKSVISCVFRRWDQIDNIFGVLEEGFP